MENQAIVAAKQKLALHNEMGPNSRMSIHEVAKLMDLITFGFNNELKVECCI